VKFKLIEKNKNMVRLEPITDDKEKKTITCNVDQLAFFFDIDESGYYVTKKEFQKKYEEFLVELYMVVRLHFKIEQKKSNLNESNLTQSIKYLSKKYKMSVDDVYQMFLEKVKIIENGLIEDDKKIEDEICKMSGLTELKNEVKK